VARAEEHAPAGLGENDRGAMKRLALFIAALPGAAIAQAASGAAASDPIPLAPVAIAIGFVAVAALLAIIVAGPLRAGAHVGVRRPWRRERR